jgi:SAM-dependent methyltransferase
VGGCSSPSILAAHGPRSWNCVNLNPQAVSAFNEQARNLALNNYSAVLRDAATYESRDSYDRIYSINSFEHITNLASALNNMYKALAPGGSLFTIFGPIWSSDVGHHLSIPTPGGSLNFFDGVLAPWEHLTSTPDAIYAKLEKLHGSEVASRAVEYIFSYPDLNRLFEHEYLAIIRDSGFIPAMIVRNKKGTPPPVAGASRTREFAMVLRRQRTPMSQKALYLLKFGWAYLENKLQT